MSQATGGAMKGHYCVMQYCPDPSRGEAANVGVVLFVEGTRSLAARTSESLGRVSRFFGPDDAALLRIADAVRANAKRILRSGDEIRTPEDLDRFARSMGNDVRLTPPLVVRVGDVAADLDRLYDELVGDGGSV